MTTDLHRALADLAGSVDDDALPGRLTGHVRPLVRHIRRRRAVATAGTSLAGLGLAAAALVWLPGTSTDGVAPRPAAGPAADVLADVGVAAEGMACASALPPAPAAVEGYRLTLAEGTPTQVAVGDPVDVVVGLEVSREAAVQVVESTPVAILVLRDGALVGVHGRDLGTGTLQNGSAVTSTGPQELTESCDPARSGAPLAAGDYALVAATTWTLADGTLVPLRTEPWPLTVSGATRSPDPAAPSGAATEPSGDEEAGGLSGGAEAERLVGEILAGAPASVFPRCGAPYPPGELTGSLTAELEVSGAPSWATEPLTGTLTLSVGDATQVIANVPTSGGHIVYLRDGVVVGAGYWDPEDVELTTVSQTQNPQVPASGLAVVCRTDPTDAPGTPLPPGAYQAVAVLEVALKEVTLTDGTTTSPSYVEQVLSAPVDVEVTGTYE